MGSTRHSADRQHTVAKARLLLTDLQRAFAIHVVQPPKTSILSSEISHTSTLHKQDGCRLATR